jgi:hypothetical protein
MDFKLTPAKSLLKSVSKEFKGSFEDKAMGISGMINDPIVGSIKQMTPGKLRRMYQIGQQQLRQEVKEERKKIKGLDISVQEKKKMDRNLGNAVLKIDTKFKSLLGFDK